jgi:hypothetical protein
MATALRKIARAASLFMIALLVTLITCWGVLALYYFDPLLVFARISLAVLFGALGLITAALVFVPRVRASSLTIFAIAFGMLLVFWSHIAPSNNREWKPGVAVLAYATFDGNRVTLHNIRDFDYRTESDFRIAYYDRTFDLDRLDSVDLLASYWAGPRIAHVIVSFGFRDSPPVAISIERRDERNEDYSTIKGLFKQYELFYVVADERDVVRLRTNVRRDPPEQVYLYRVHGRRDDARRLFLAYMEELNSLQQHPRFYNTLTTNCTTSIWLNARVNPERVPFSWKILLSGYLPEYLYEQGRLDTTVPFAELQRRSLINPAAAAADRDSEFSQRIRAGIPGLPLL